MSGILIPKRLVGVNLINFAARDPQGFMQMCEQDYAARILHMAEAVQAAGCPIVMLAGPSASGKTTSSHRLAEQLIRLGCPAQVVSLDDFYKNPENYPRLADGSKDYENVWALDLNCLHECLDRLVNEGECDLPEFDFVTERRKEKLRHVCRNGGVVIVEGIHALNPLLNGNLKSACVYRIYAGLREEFSDAQGVRILPTRDLRLMRRMMRDYRHRSHRPIETLELWDLVRAGEDKFIRVFKQDADYVMDTSYSIEPCLMAGQVQALREDPDAGWIAPADETELAARLRRLLERISAFQPLGLDLLSENSLLNEFFT